MVNEDIPALDKEWLAVDSDSSTVFTCSEHTMAHVSYAGVLLGSHDFAFAAYHNCIAAYVDDGGFHWMTMNHEVWRWDGVTDPVLEVSARDYGDAWTLFSRVAGSVGPLGDGQWIVRSMKSTDAATVVLETTTGPGSAVTQRQLSPPGVTAFFPAATMDAQGRLHAVWYETSRATGVLRYTRSATSDLAGEFLAPYTIDPDACPGDDWYPYSDGEEPPGGRRLREYIDIAISGERAHIVWAHAPAPPARIHATYVDSN